MNERRSIGSLGSVAAKKSSSDVNATGMKPCRKRLKELKKLKLSKFVPTVIECWSAKKVKLSVNWKTFWCRILLIENGSCPIDV